MTRVYSSHRRTSLVTSLDRRSSSNEDNYFETHFLPWREQVRVIVLEEMGLEIDDIQDFPYAANFEAGTSPRDMADIVIDDLVGMYRFMAGSIDTTETAEP